MINESSVNLKKKIINQLENNKIDDIKKNLTYLEKRIQIENEINTNEIHPRVLELLDIPQYEQRSVEWFDQRKNKLTSSDVDSVLGRSKYNTREDVLFKKCGISPPFIGNDATLHGQKYEDEAIDLYCKQYNKKTFSFGLLPHPTIEFLAGSPDDITYDGIVIEVKCPLRRKIVNGEIPVHYEAQVRMNMEICDLNDAVFIEYKPSCLTGGDIEFNVVELKRDRSWFTNIYQNLVDFWDDVQYYRNKGIDTHPRYSYHLKKSQPKLHKKTTQNIKCLCNSSDFEDSSEEDKDDSDYVDEDYKNEDN